MKPQCHYFCLIWNNLLKLKKKPLILLHTPTVGRNITKIEHQNFMCLELSYQQGKYLSKPQVRNFCSRTYQEKGHSLVSWSNQYPKIIHNVLNNQPILNFSQAWRHMRKDGSIYALNTKNLSKKPTVLI